MTIEQYFEALKAHHKGKTPYGFDTAKDFEIHFNAIENAIKEQGLTVEQYLFISNNIEQYREIRGYNGIQFFEQWKRTKNI
jgi:hypothetical protein